MPTPYREFDKATRCFYCSQSIGGQARVRFFEDEEGRRAFVCELASCAARLERDGRELKDLPPG